MKGSEDRTEPVEAARIRDGRIGALTEEQMHRVDAWQPIRTVGSPAMFRADDVRNRTNLMYVIVQIACLRVRMSPYTLRDSATIKRGKRYVFDLCFLWCSECEDQQVRFAWFSLLQSLRRIR
jgi:hypothetical protein